MTELVRIGEHTMHDTLFQVDRPKGHQVYLLLIVESKARFLIGDKWEDVEPGTIFLFLPGQKHRYCANKEAYIDSWAHIESDTLLLGEHFPYGMPIKIQDQISYKNLFHLLCEEYFGRDSNRNTVMYHMLMALLHKIKGEMENTNLRPIYYEMSKLRTQIYLHPEQDWTVSSVAKQLNISNGYLQMLYPKYFHTTCINDVIESRMQASEELLLSTDKLLDEIAELCGYHHTEHFIRQFKKWYGMTPGRFRKQYEEND
ncbi:transcriptional regulator, AraC family [Lachnospiraceae bacterium KM106-2]|nr:transcriptional regulator, AraC family [Lachnospiraceae bacterium KM106-2]